MSRIDIQNLLNQQPIAPSISPTPSQPDFKQAQLSGGQVRLGQAAQQIGPSSEEALFNSLAQIAGGVESSINVFSKISQIEDQKKIGDIETQFDQIDQTDLTPEEKKEKLDELLKNVWTPMSGKGWKEKLATNADRRWLSEEGRNSFEEKRYRREFVKFLNEERNVTRGDTPELEEVFQREYQDRYPTSEYNNWFRLKTFDTGSKLIQKKVQDALTLFPLSVEAAIPVPNEEQRKKALLGNTEIKEQFKVFFDLEGLSRLSPNVETFAANVKDYLESNLISKLDPNTPPEVYSELARQLPALALQKAKQITDASNDFKLNEVQQDAYTSIDLAKQNLVTTEDKLQGINFLLDTFGSHLNTLDIPRAEKREIIYQLVPTIVDQLDAAITQGTDRNIKEKFPGWEKMTAVERVDAAMSILQGWVETGNNKTRIMDILKFTPDEIKGLASSPEAAADKLVFQNARIQALLSKPVQERFAEDVSRNLETVTFTGQSLGAYATTEAIITQVDNQIITVANKLGISVNSLRSAYRDTKGNYKTEIKPEDWFRSLTPEEQNTLTQRGFTLGNFQHSLKYINAVKELELVAAKTMQEKKFNPDAKSALDVDKITKQAGNFAPSIQSTESMTKASIATEVLTGRAYATGDNKEFLALLNQYRIVRNNLTTDTKLSEEEKKQLTDFVKLVDTELPFMSGYADALDKGLTEMLADLGSMSRQIPSYSSTTSPNQEMSLVEMAQEFSQQSNAVLSGERKVDFKSQPTVIIDEKDGTWSKEARYNLLSAGFMAKRVFAPDSKAADKKLFNETIDSALTRIANGGTDYMQSPNGKYDLTLLATIGRVFRQETVRTGRFPEIHKADYFVRRAAILGNWSNETNVDDMLLKLNSPDSRNFIDANLRVPLALASLVKGDVNLAASYEQTGGMFTKELIFTDKSTIRVASALGAQMLPYVVDPKLKLEIPGTTVNANSIEWSSEKLRQQLELSLGAPVSIQELANSFRGLLTGFNASEIDAMTPQEQVRAAVQVINRVTEGNEGMLRDTVSFIFGDFGLNNPNLQPRDGESKLDLFTSMLSTALGIQHNYVLNQRNIDLKIGTTPTVPLVISRGSVTQQRPNDTMVVTSVLQDSLAIYGNSYSTSFGGGPLTVMNATLRETGKAPQVLAELEKKYPPEDLIDRATGGKGKANGLMYILGATSLDSPVPNDLRARFSVVEEWANAHGIKNPEQFMSQSFTIIKPGTATPSIESSARIALREVLTKENISLKQMLEELNTKYLSLGGRTPLFNPKEYDPTKPGYAELEQRQTMHSSRSSKLPTFKWSNRSNLGVPFIKLTDAYYFIEAMGGDREEYRYTNIKNNLEENYVIPIKAREKAAIDGDISKYFWIHPMR
jgi:hypothetical protein